MNLECAQFLVTCLGIYAAIGVVFAIFFVIFRIDKIDPAAQTMPRRVRLIVLSGCALLWPLMLYKTFTQKRPPLL